MLMSVGAEIKKARLAAGISQRALAERLGWDQARISHYERDTREPVLNDLIRIADALGCAVESLILIDKTPLQRQADLVRQEFMNTNEELRGAVLRVLRICTDRNGRKQRQ